MKFLIMLHYKRPGPLSGGIAFIGVLDSVPKKKYPPALIRTSGSDIYDASKYMWRFVPLLLYSVSSSGCAVM